MANGYWNNLQRARLSRRRVIAGAGTATAAAAFLAACGGSGSDKTPKDVSGLLTTPVETTDKAVRGGTWPTVLTADVPHFDSIGRYHTGAYAENLMSYSVLADFKPTVVKGETYPLWGFEPEGAESWEYSPDGLTLTWKLRQGLKTDPRAPTNGRAYDSSDLEFSFKKFGALNARRGDILNEINANSPVISASYPDARTMVWKLAFPSPVLFQKINRYLMLTKEGDINQANGYNPLNEMRGTGPFMMTEWQEPERKSSRGH